MCVDYKIPDVIINKYRSGFLQREPLIENLIRITFILNNQRRKIL